MEFAAKIKDMGCDCKMHIFADDEEIGVCTIGQDSGVGQTRGIFQNLRRL